VQGSLRKGRSGSDCDDCDGTPRFRGQVHQRAALGGGLSTLRITQAVFEAVRAHGEATYPDECCGALIGEMIADGWRVTGAIRAENTRSDSAHNRYEIAPLELVQIGSEARKQGLEIAGFYHSHPDHPAEWSGTDFAEAHWLGYFYVITEVSKGRAAVTKAFLLAGRTEEKKQFVNEPILIED